MIRKLLNKVIKKSKQIAYDFKGFLIFLFRQQLIILLNFESNEPKGLKYFIPL